MCRNVRLTCIRFGVGGSWTNQPTRVLAMRAMLLQLSILLLLTSLSSARTLLEQAWSMNDALRHSPFGNLTDEQLGHALQNLKYIAQAPVLSTLTNASELRLFGAAFFCHSQLSRFPALTEDNLEAWLRTSIEFLEAHAKGNRSIFLPTNQSSLLPSARLSGLPMVRRSLLAHLITGWLTTLQRQLPPRLEPQLARLITLMYDIHKTSVVHRGVMQYHHISKSGGTAWNEAARSNGCVVPLTLGNHVRGFGDECRWIDPKVYGPMNGGKLILWARWGLRRRPGAGSSCWQRFGRVAADGLSYISNEYTLIGGREEGDLQGATSCPQFVHVVTLRHPLRRLESALRFIQVYIRGYWGRDDPQQGLKRYRITFCNATAGLWRQLAPPVTDNYVVRTFLGESGFHTPPGRIGPIHLTAARHQLLTFDLVLALEAGEEANDQMVQQGLGWPAAWSKANHTLNGTVLSRYIGHECGLAPAVLHDLEQAQGADMQFYRFGRVVNQLDALWLDLSRGLGLRPEVLPGALELGATPQDIRCGMLWRGSNDSTLARALRPQV